MNNKLINREIRSLSNHSSLPLLMFVILSELSSFIVYLIFDLLKGNSLGQDEGFEMFVAYCLIYLVVMPLIILMFSEMRGKRVGLSIKSCFVRPAKPAGWVAKYVIITIGLTYLIAISSNLIQLLLSLFGVELNTTDISFGDSPFGIITTLIALPIFAPLFEELLFRGCIYRNNEPMGQWFAIIVSGIAFGLWHTNCVQTVYAAVMGILSCALYAKTRSVIPSMIVHFVVNSIAAVQELCLLGLDQDLVANGDEMYIAQHSGLITLTGLIGMLIFGLIIASVVLVIMEIVKHRGHFTLEQGRYNMPLGRKLGVYYSAPITIIAFAVLIFETVVNAVFA